MYIAIIAETEDHKIAKYQEFKNQAAADAHVEKYGGFIVVGTCPDINYTTVDMIAKTLILDTVKRDNDKIMNDWIQEMTQSDAEITREQEDLIDHLIDDHVQIVNPVIKARRDKKKEIRSRRP